MKQAMRFAIPVATFLTLSGTVFLIWAGSQLPETWQPYICESNRCTLMDWLAATSGWVGFAAAALGAYFVYHQLYEQRKQTAFILGDSPPTFEMYRTAWVAQNAQFRLINWNRDLVVIRNIKLQFGGRFVTPTQITYRQEAVDERLASSPINKEGRLGMGRRVDGWVDRQGSPKIEYFELDYDEAVISSLPSGKTKIPARLIIQCEHPSQAGIAMYELSTGATLNVFFPIRERK
ncbi:hypothetical protein [Rhizobium leguminosarum]